MFNDATGQNQFKSRVVYLKNCRWVQIAKPIMQWAISTDALVSTLTSVKKIELQSYNGRDRLRLSRRFPLNYVKTVKKKGRLVLPIQGILNRLRPAIGLAINTSRL